MQVHDGPQIDLSAQVAMVRRKTRPWKSIIALVLAIAAAATSGWAHSQFRHFFAGGHVVDQVIAAATAAAFCVFASAATIGLSGKARERAQAGDRRRPTPRSSATRSSSSARSPR